VKGRDTILIVEDDRNTAALVATYLEREGYATLTAHDGERGLDLARRHRPIFVILDLMLPKADGLKVCCALREFSDVPVLMLTARGEEVDRVVGFSVGAGDYVVKPFSPRELVERVKAILRRARKSPALGAAVLTHGALRLDPERHKVTIDDRTVALTPSEYKILHTLMSVPGRVFSRDELLGQLHVHGEAVIDRVIDVHIGRLRQKIERDPARPRYITTVRGVGYSMAEEM